MRMQIEVAALVVLLVVATIGTASADSAENGGSPIGDAAILAALGIQANAYESNTPPEIDITNFDWIDRDRLSIEVVGESETEPRGLFKVHWDHRQVAEIELLEMPIEYCKAVNTGPPCYLVADANEHDELKAPLGTWHVTNEDVPDIYTGLPSVGDPVSISSDILKAASQP